LTLKWKALLNRTLTRKRLLNQLRARLTMALRTSLRGKEGRESLKLLKMLMPPRMANLPRKILSPSRKILNLPRMAPLRKKVNLSQRELERRSQRRKTNLRLQMGTLSQVVKLSQCIARRVRLPRRLKMDLLLLQAKISLKEKEDLEQLKNQRTQKMQQLLEHLRMVLNLEPNLPKRKKEREVQSQIKMLKVVTSQKSQSIDQKERKLRRLKVMLRLMELLKMVPTRARRKRKLMLQRISFIKTQWTSKRRENSNPSGKSTVMVTGEKDQAKLLLLLRLKFQLHQRSFSRHRRRKLSIQSRLRWKTESRKLLLLSKRRRPVSKIF